MFRGKYEERAACLSNESQHPTVEECIGVNSDLNYRLRKYLDCLENKERIWRESVDVRKERKDLHIPTQEEYAGVRTLDKK